MYGDERKVAEEKEMAYTSFIRLVASDRGARKIGVLSSTLFALAYAFAIGMIFRNPIPVPEYITVPQVILITRGPIGQVPWLVVYADRYWTISVNLEAALSMLAISTLIGLNASALYYISRRAACCLSPSGFLRLLLLLRWWACVCRPALGRSSAAHIRGHVNVWQASGGSLDSPVMAQPVLPVQELG
jgi:hypothetical protein